MYVFPVPGGPCRKIARVRELRAIRASSQFSDAICLSLFISSWPRRPLNKKRAAHVAGKATYLNSIRPNTRIPLHPRRARVRFVSLQSPCQVLTLARKPLNNIHAKRASREKTISTAFRPPGDARQVERSSDFSPGGNDSKSCPTGTLQLSCQVKHDSEFCSPRGCFSRGDVRAPRRGPARWGGGGVPDHRYHQFFW